MTTMTTMTTTTVAPAKPTRRKVEHYFWVDEMDFSSSIGIDMRSLCGVWAKPERLPPGWLRNEVEVVGRLIPLPDPEDCKRCLRTLEAYYRRCFERRNR